MKIWILIGIAMLSTGCSKQPTDQPASGRITNAMLTAACHFSAREVSADGEIAIRPFIRPEHVVSIEPAKKLYTGNIAMLIKLNDSGQKRMLSYTKDNVGGRIAIYCGDKKIDEPTIAAPFSNDFRIDLPDKTNQSQRSQ